MTRSAQEVIAIPSTAPSPRACHGLVLANIGCLVMIMETFVVLNGGSPTSWPLPGWMQTFTICFFYVFSERFPLLVLLLVKFGRRCHARKKRARFIRFDGPVTRRSAGAPFSHRQHSLSKADPPAWWAVSRTPTWLDPESTGLPGVQIAVGIHSNRRVPGLEYQSWRELRESSVGV